MMMKLVNHGSDGINKAAHNMVASHDAIKERIAGHAEKHSAELDTRRKEAVRQRRIEHGIEKHNAKVQTDNQ